MVRRQAVGNNLIQTGDWHKKLFCYQTASFYFHWIWSPKDFRKMFCLRCLTGFWIPLWTWTEIRTPGANRVLKQQWIFVLSVTLWKTNLWKPLSELKVTVISGFVLLLCNKWLIILLDLGKKNLTSPIMLIRSGWA